jgi:uncharacterized membrane protein
MIHMTIHRSRHQGPASPLHVSNGLLRHLIAGLLLLYLFFYVSSIPILVLDRVPAWGSPIGGLLNLLQGGMLALWLYANAGRRGALAAALILALAWAVEQIGVTTGAPFGRYVYTDAFGFGTVGAVPLPIPFAWLLLIPAAIGTARLMHARIGERRWWLILIAPLLVLIYDVLLEPFATEVMGYWQWIEQGPLHGVPTANYVAWYMTALALTLLTLALCGQRVARPRVLARLPLLLYGLNLLLVTVVDLAHGYLDAGLLGLITLSIGGWLTREQLLALRDDAQRLIADVSHAIRRHETG